MSLAQFTMTPGGPNITLIKWHVGSKEEGEEGAKFKGLRKPK